VYLQVKYIFVCGKIIVTLSYTVCSFLQILAVNASIILQWPCSVTSSICISVRGEILLQLNVLLWRTSYITAEFCFSPCIHCTLLQNLKRFLCRKYLLVNNPMKSPLGSPWSYEVLIISLTEIFYSYKRIWPFSYTEWTFNIFCSLSLNSVCFIGLIFCYMFVAKNWIGKFHFIYT
jgi:hypothetical protein